MSDIIVENLCKDYKRRKHHKSTFFSPFFYTYDKISALQNVSFNVNEGEIVGYLGINGAGKSTTIKILSGILSPTSGTVNVLGLNPLHQRKHISKQIATLFGQRNQLSWDLPVADSIRLIKYMYNMSSADYNSNYSRIDTYLNISEIANIQARHLSLGQRMRANLALALVHNPKILFLDEPTIGLDILSKHMIQECIIEMNREYGTTVMLTTHDISDIQTLCKRVLLLDSGNIIYDNSLEHLKYHFSPQSGVIITFQSCTDMHAVQALLSNIGLSFSMQDAYQLQIEYDQNLFFTSDVMASLTSQFKVTSVVANHQNLEAILTSIYTGFNRRDT